MCRIIDKYENEWLSIVSTTNPICTAMTKDEASLNDFDCNFYKHQLQDHESTEKSNSILCRSLYNRNCLPKKGEMNCNTLFFWDDKSDYKLCMNREG